MPTETEGLIEMFAWSVVTYSYRYPPIMQPYHVRSWLNAYHASPNASTPDQWIGECRDATGRIADHVRRWIALGRPALVVAGWKYDPTLADGIIVDVTYE